MLAGDLAALETMLSENLAYTHSTGAKDGKQSYLQKLSSGTLRYESLEFLAPEVRILGPAGLVTATMRATVVQGGNRRQGASSYVAVWGSTGTQWTLQLVQATPLQVVT